MTGFRSSRRTEHDHDHDHEPITNGDESPAAARVRALADALVKKGVITQDDLRHRIDWLVSRTPADGAKLVARAWVDADFKQRLLADARDAALELGLDPGDRRHGRRAQNTEHVHHMVVCTLCSCYPKALLGPPPDWYKSFPYRSRAVSNPAARSRDRRLARQTTSKCASSTRRLISATSSPAPARPGARPMPEENWPRSSRETP